MATKQRTMRTDFAGPALAKVAVTALLIVGERDYEVIRLNEAAFEKLKGEKIMEIVRRATHLFEEPGTLDDVIELAKKWYTDHFASA